MTEKWSGEDSYREDPLEQLLDQESDEEFGLPEFREHLADTLTPAVLKDWSAKDFASIYVRFRPHLERHARRFLVNRSQVEEVVQDAFLYLMTTLPELDSELGVLRFLKWKVRLLCLDVIRANSRASMAPIDEQPEMEADLPEMSRDLERAEDAAIVSLALAKLQPRHREALISTLYEEKSTEVVAAQMGLSENAFRQLLFRARSSFKKALIGEAETAGLSMSAILSIAARKAAAESGKVIGAASALLIALAVSIGVLPSQFVRDNQVVQSAAENPVQASQPESVQITAPEATSEPVAPAQPQAESVVAEVEPATIEVIAQPALAITTPAAVTQEEIVQAPTIEPIFVESNLTSILNTNVTQAGYYNNSYASSPFLAAGFKAGSIEVFGGTGISAFLDIDLDTHSVYNVVFQIWVDGKRYYAVAEQANVDTYSTASGFEIVHNSSEFWVVDDAGNVYDQSPLAGASATVVLKLDKANNPYSASLKVNR